MGSKRNSTLEIECVASTKQFHIDNNSQMISFRLLSFRGVVSNAPLSLFLFSVDIFYLFCNRIQLPNKQKKIKAEKYYETYVNVSTY